MVSLKKVNGYFTLTVKGMYAASGPLPSAFFACSLGLMFDCGNSITENYKKSILFHYNFVRIEIEPDGIAYSFFKIVFQPFNVVIVIVSGLNTGID
jgi:hypothetical protein